MVRFIILVSTSRLVVATTYNWLNQTAVDEVAFIEIVNA